MLFTTYVLAFATFFSVQTSALPTSFEDPAYNATLVPRQDYCVNAQHQGAGYSDSSCQNKQGDASGAQTIDNFRCDGSCTSYPNGINSVWLWFDNVNGCPQIRLTADCYASTDCSGDVAQHAGIEDFNPDGYTQTVPTVFRCRYYWNCFH